VDLVIATIVVLYLTGGFDRYTLRATRGAAGFVSAGAKGAARHVKAERAKTAKQRARERDRRHARMWASGFWGRVGVCAEKGAWIAGRWTANGVRTAWAGATAAPEGYTKAADAAVQRKAERKAKRAEAKKRRRESADARFLMGDAEPFIPDTSAATAAEDATPEENPVTDTTDIRVSELTNVGDLIACTQRLISHVEALSDDTYQYIMAASGLPEALSEAGFSTRLIAGAVESVQEALLDMRPLLAAQEALSSLLAAAKAAADIGDAVEAQAASGDAQRFVTA